GTNLPNCTNYFLTLQNVQSNQAGSYKVIVSNEISSEESQSATLNVWVPPTIITQPTNQSVPLGGTAQFSVTVQGTSPFYYQWRKNGTNIPNATVVPYIILNAQSSDAADYSVVISNIAGVVTSATAHLTVNLPPTILVQPKSQSVMVGSSVTFSVVDSGGTSYQWKKNGANISGATNSIYIISSVKKDDAGNYSVVVSNAGGSVTSQYAVLTVIEPQTTAGMVVIWGENSNIWNGYEYIDLTPPGGLTNVTLLAAGSFHCLALLKSGQVIGWGDNRYGKASASISSVKSITAGQNHSLALLSNGTIYVWGDNTYGQTNPPGGLTNIIAIASGLNHCLVLKSNKTVVGWGKNTYGQATPIPGLTNVIAIATGSEHSLALRADGTVASWGRNDDGQTRVPAGLSNVVAVAGGGGHSLALLNNGTVTCWGRNNHGQSTPPLNLFNVMAIAAGENHSIALLSNNTVVCWGANNYGQIEVPEDLKGVVCLTAGPNYNLAAFLTPLQLTISHYFSNTYQIQASRIDASPIENWRLNQIRLFYSTNLTINNWTNLNITPSYDNGSLFYMILITNNIPRFYRIVEIP
ncbi:MAG TPA: immunoglobulin domain-containing protein, partial [Verrucomicrobiota bacterium]|nr:immunoglobulin domain-containing protein [Verrucomicrobiota bacterium]